MARLHPSCSIFQPAVLVRSGWVVGDPSTARGEAQPFVRRIIARVSTRASQSLTLSVLSQLPVARMPPCWSTKRTPFTGASCAATCEDWPVDTSNMRAALSAPAEKIFVPSCKGTREGHWPDQYLLLRRSRRRQLCQLTLLQVTSSTGPSWEYMALAEVVPLLSTP